MPYIIACTIEKGGVGKTTTTVNLGAALARTGKQVLLIDLDPQAHTTTWLSSEQPDETIFEVIQKPEEGLTKAIISSRFSGIDLVCGARALGMADRLFSTTAEGTPRNPMIVLRRALREIPQKYDFVIIDCPPSVGILNLNAIAAANELLIPLDPSDLAYNGLSQIALTLSQLIEEEIISKVPALSILFTCVDPRHRSARKITDRVKGAADRPYTIFDRTIRDRVIMRELHDMGKTAFDISSAADIAEDYAAVADELLQRISSKCSDPEENRKSVFRSDSQPISSVIL